MSSMQVQCCAAATQDAQMSDTCNMLHASEAVVQVITIDVERPVCPAERKFNEGAAQVKRLLNRDRSGVPDLDKPASFDTDDVASDDGSGAASENGSQQPAAESSGRLSGAL